MGSIKILDERTIQKIAAGEIIERPSSVVKELIENSLDADASNITIEIKNGGKSYIRVTDDGDGIVKEELSVAFQRHSTSKLSSANDLYRIMSFGFRGEALASISAIARIEVLTKTDSDLIGTHAFLREGDIVKIDPVGSPKGTTMIVTRMFHNVPVRESFLKSDTVEASHISDIVYKLALGNTNVSFKYIKDNKVIFKTSKHNNLFSNIYTLLGKEFSENLIEVNYEGSNFKIYGYISNNKFYRSNRTHQYLYINNRSIKDSNISSLIEKRYRSIIPTNRFPVFILFIDIDPSLIDINIHPTKEEIKFMNQQQIKDDLKYIIGETINKSLSIPRTKLTRGKEKIFNELPLLYKEDALTIKDSVKVHDNSITKSYNTQQTKDILVNESDKSDYGLFELRDVLEQGKIIGTLFSTYILVEVFQSEKLFIIDQHAAHERVLYEKLKKEYREEEILIQNLLQPEIMEMSNIEVQMIIDHASILKKLGFIIEEFGSNSIIIRAVPILFGNPQTESFLLEILDTIEADIKNSYEAKLDKIIKIACGKAIKSGDKMNDIEIESLLEQLFCTQNPYSCPHGRPTIIKVSKSYIDKEFKRIT